MFGVEGLTPALLAGVTLVTAIGATLQGAVGFGMGLFVVPILLVLDPAFVPGPTLMTMATLTLAMTWRERNAVEWRQLGYAIAGRIPGIGAALVFLSVTPPGSAEPVLGVLVLIAVALSASGLHVQVRPAALIGAGALSGFMGTSVSIGGPPIALLYQREEGPRFRATLSAFFTIGVAISLVGLASIGRFGAAELTRVGILLPGTAIGFLLSSRFHGALDQGYLRPAILVLAGLMGAGVIVRSALRDGPRELTVVSYNIRHGRGMDDRVDLERTAAVLRRLDADVIGLQEVDRGTERAARVAQADSLGALLDVHAAFGAFMPHQGGAYGMAILSRLPIRRTAPLRLPDGNEPRVALMVVLDLPDGDSVRVVNVHFDWVEDDGYRFAQATALAAILDTLGGPVVVLGDFNDVPGSRTLGLFARLMAATKPATDHLTFSSTEPVKEIDHVFVRPAAMWDLGEVAVIDEPMASDHRPVRVVLRRR